MSLPGGNPPLAVDALCSIIEACGNANVAELKFGDLYLKMGQKTPISDPRSLSLEDSGQLELPLPRPSAKEIAELQAKEAKRALERDEIAIREQQLADMFIEDPAEAERLLIQGELRDGEFDEAEEA